MVSDPGRDRLEAKVEHALGDLRAITAALERLDDQLRSDRERAISSEGRAAGIVGDLRDEMTTALTSMRNDVAATVVHLEVEVENRLRLLTAVMDLGPRVEALERAASDHGW